ncbi:hypothetical protein EMA8858_02952 [Emticicia aquatica]|uniref:Tetratricopeptide repeat protein n=1 Tax=Emticicia aquatica TaxID=1681835 RepID=A0ABM9AS65_9BACT|nr:hypothetical protein [Emticicia aquatica]CAH0996817.1 hypothetical protein EMA8858_02952 [Emticicia aquatica]
MQKLFFWQNWPKTERFSFLSILVILVISLLFLAFYCFKGLENVIHWDILSELDEIPSTLDSFSDGNLKFTINGNAYIVKEHFLASTMAINLLANHVFGICFAIGLCLLLSAFSSMSRYWFLGGMVLLAGILITFHLEIVFNTINQMPFLVAFGMFAGLAFYFNTFEIQASFFKRFLFFVAITIIAGSLIGFMSKTQMPSFAILSYGLLSAIIISAIFILFVSHEILSGLVWVVSNSGVKNRNHLSSFLAISSIYLLNVLLIYLEKSQYIDWNILSISPLVLYVSSMILGIWGFRDYCEQANFFNFRTIGAWLYLGLAIISTATIGYAYATANDSLIEAFEDFISYSHFAVGLCFFFYVLINFTQLLLKGLDVHKVIYKPKFYEFLLFRLAAIIIVFVLISFKNYNNYFQTKAGYFNAIADFYNVNEDLQAAETFYKEALHYDVRNHKSNYALASLAINADDKENTGIFLKNALEKNASPFAYAGLSKVLQEKDMFFDALFTLREGVSKFPKNQQLLTNIALLYEKTKVTDSTLHYLNLAKENCTDCDLAESNLLAYQLKYGENDSLYKAMISSNPKLGGDNRASKNMSLRANRAAADKIMKVQANTNLVLPKDSALNVSQFALLYNLSSFNNRLFPYSSKDLQNIQRKEINNSFFEDLEFAISCRNYFTENKLSGLKQLAILANDSTKHKPLYNQVVGMWFLQQGVYDKAIMFLSRAGDISSVEILQKQDYKKTIDEFQQAQASEIIKKLKTKADFDKALAENPLNPIILSKVLDFYNTKLKKPNEAYNFIFRAVELNDNAIELWKLYTLQSLKIGTKDYAEDGLLKLQQLSTPADYQAFLSIYQAQKALMEKTKDGFE